jgi:glutathione S-transferase
MEYLEERFPAPALLPADREERARARLRIFRTDQLTDPYYELRREEDGARERLDRQLARLDGSLGQRPWLGGSGYGLADIAYVPWLLRARDLLGVELDPFPALSDWLQRMLQRPAVAAEADVVASL